MDHISCQASLKSTAIFAGGPAQGPLREKGKGGRELGGGGGVWCLQMTVRLRGGMEAEEVAGCSIAALNASIAQGRPPLLLEADHRERGCRGGGASRTIGGCCAAVLVLWR